MVGKLAVVCLRAALTMGLIGWGGAVMAQGTPAGRYPWDYRPPKCLAPEAINFGPCQANDWPSYKQTIARLNQLWDLRDFALLERALNELTFTEDGLYPNGVNKAAAADRILGAWAVRDQQGMDDRLAQWRAAFPQSDYLQLMDAIALYQEAWRARGNGSASTVSPESWEIFAARLRAAERKLLDARSAFKDTALWHLRLLEVALEEQGETDPRRLFLQAVERWPRHLSFYSRMLWRLQPKWGGSWEVVESFIDQSTRHVEATDGQTFYARLYVSLEDEVVKGKTAMDWQRMRRGFDDWIARDPSPRIKNLYASYACFARDKVAFAKAFNQIPKDKIEADAWLRGYSYKACLLWAGI